MKAKLVTFVVKARVVVNDTATDDDAASVAVDKILSNVEDYIHTENLECVEDDTEVPYNPQYDKEVDVEEVLYCCPECGEPLHQGDYYYDYDSGVLRVECCPNCGCEDCAVDDME